MKKLFFYRWRLDSAGVKEYKIINETDSAKIRTYSSGSERLDARLIFCVFISAFLFFISGCSLTTGKTENKKGGKAPKGPPSVVVEPVTIKTVSLNGDYAAKIDPANGADIVEIRARVDATLQKQHFTEGEPVKKGQLLFTLDTTQYDAELRLAKAALNKAQADWDQAKNSVAVKIAESNLISAKAQLELTQINAARLKPLMEKKAVPRQDYDNAVTNERVARAKVAEMKAELTNAVLNQKAAIEQSQAAIETANAQINKANIDIDYCYIKSPIDGIAGKRRVAPGNLVGHGEATLLTTVTVLDPLRISFSISESDYLRLHKNSLKNGMSGANSENLTLILSNGKKYPHKGKIIIQEPTLDSKTNTLNIIAEFPNPEKLLRPGMFGRINMVVDYRSNAVLIPQKAVMAIQNIQYCYVVNKDDLVEMRNLRLEDQQAGNMAIVKEGLKPGEKVITEGLLKVKPGVKVKIVPKTASGKQGGK